MKLHNTTTDRIEKAIVLRAPQSRVWRALANAQEFGKWFGIEFKGAFKPGERIEGQITSPGYEHVTIEFTIERMDPESRLSYRWHPYAIDPAIDYSSEPTTLVEFHLEEVPGGTQLTVIESGFDRIPLARRAEALRMNDDGWASQLVNIERHVGA
jgi:uncharacterized protein YndB with AHSA1/START domain